MLPQLNIAHMKAKLPIIQGGMAVRVSTARLAAAVANEGGIGVIAGTGLSLTALRAEIRKARQLTTGYIGVNILFAVTKFAELVKTAMQEKVDFIVSGAGFSRDMYSWGREMNVPIISIASTERVARLAEKLGAAAIIVEGKEAGGHLATDQPLLDILGKIAAAVKVPVLAAGGIMHGADIAQMLSLGAQGVQIATRFVTSEECEAHANFKQLYLQSTAADTVMIDSPVGLPGRALRNSFTERLHREKQLKIDKCDNCLKHCSRNFCILAALNKAVDGDTENGLVFAGENFYRVKEILSVKKIIARLKEEYEQAVSPA